MFVGAFAAESDFAAEGGGVAGKMIEGENEGVTDGAIHLLNDAREVGEGVGGELGRVVVEAKLAGGGGSSRSFVRGGTEANGDGRNVGTQVLEVVCKEGGVDAAGEVGGYGDVGLEGELDGVARGAI